MPGASSARRLARRARCPGSTRSLRGTEAQAAAYSLTGDRVRRPSTFSAPTGRAARNHGSTERRSRRQEKHGQSIDDDGVPFASVVLTCEPKTPFKSKNVWATETGEDMEGEKIPGGYYVSLEVDAPRETKLAIVGETVAAVEVQPDNPPRRRFWVVGEPSISEAQEKLKTERIASALAGKPVQAEEN